MAAQTAINVGYVEQLYTFGDRGRHARPDDTGMHMISVGYLALTRMSDNAAALRKAPAGFEPWYRFFPWEDWRDGRPGILDQTIVPLLEQWSKTGKREPARPPAAGNGCGIASRSAARPGTRKRCSTATTFV